MFRFILATALSSLIALPAFAQDRCEANLISGPSDSPVVNTTALHEALADVPVPKVVDRVDEALHRALLDSSKYGSDSAWTNVAWMEEEMAELGYRSAPLGALVVQAAMQRQAQAAANEVAGLTKRMRGLRIEYGKNQQAIQQLQAPQPQFEPKPSGRRTWIGALKHLTPTRFVAAPSADDRARARRVQELQDRNRQIGQTASKVASAQSQAIARQHLYGDAAASAQALICAMVPEFQLD